MICVSLTSTSLEQLQRDMKAAAQFADVIEIRLDYLPINVDLTPVLKARAKPVIVTCRRVQEGGQYDSDERVRILALQNAARNGADYIDVELDSASEVRDVPAKRIVSYHDFRGVPDNIEKIHAQCAETKPEIVKLAVMANRQADNVKIFQLLKATAVPTAAFCMGPFGTPSRIIGRKFGSRMTYACLNAGAESAPGQVAADELKNLYRYHQIDSETEVYGVVAKPVAHSMSPAIHNSAFKVTGRNAVYVPLLVENPVEFVQAYSTIDAKGYSVTIPHKETIMPALDENDDTAQAIGAVNTVVNRNGRLFGYNTDYMAAIGELESVTELLHKKAVMIGAGGAARAIAFGLKLKQVDLTVADIAIERAEKLAKEVGCKAASVDDLDKPDVDILINATPAGMHPKEDTTAIPADWFKPGMTVFDVVYNPIETRLLREARQAGCKTVSGFDMFVSQAAAQFKLWTGEEAPVGVMAEVVRDRLTGK